MLIDRRKFLLSACALPLAPAVFATPARQRVVIVGGGWGGLAAARQLSALTPDFEVILVEKNAHFFSLPLANRWLIGQDDGSRLRTALAPVAKSLGYQWLAEEVSAIDRANRQVVTTGQRIAYDWLILAPGIREDWTALAAVDPPPGAKSGEAFGSTFASTFGSAFVNGSELDALKERLANFGGGHLLMSIPPQPYRCPPAPYERAVMLAWLFKTRGLKFHLTLIEPNAPWPAYQRIFREHFRDEITYRPQTRLEQVDAERRIARLDFDDLSFDDAILMPPQQAGELCWQAGLISRAADGRVSGWADVDPETFQSRADPRVFVIGDSVGRVSPLFGYYPKTGQIAARMGSIVADEISARRQGQKILPALPESTCYTQMNVEPAETIRIETHYTRRSDGPLVQHTQQSRNNFPAGEADAWLAGMHQALFGPR